MRKCATANAHPPTTSLHGRPVARDLNDESRNMHSIFRRTIHLHFHSDTANIDIRRFGDQTAEAMWRAVAFAPVPTGVRLLPPPANGAADRVRIRVPRGRAILSRTWQFCGPTDMPRFPLLAPAGGNSDSLAVEVLD